MGIDSDRDGLPDTVELALGASPSATDSAGDGLADALKLNLGLNLGDVDTDNDGIWDIEELRQGTNPRVADDVANGIIEIVEAAVKALQRYGKPNPAEPGEVVGISQFTLGCDEVGVWVKWNNGVLDVFLEDQSLLHVLSIDEAGGVSHYDSSKANYVISELQAIAQGENNYTRLSESTWSQEITERQQKLAEAIAPDARKLFNLCQLTLELYDGRDTINLRTSQYNLDVTKSGLSLFRGEDLIFLLNEETARATGGGLSEADLTKVPQLFNLLTQALTVEPEQNPSTEIKQEVER
jgi:Bacterial TSP3 repeat